MDSPQSSKRVNHLPPRGDESIAVPGVARRASPASDRFGAENIWVLPCA